MNSIEFKSFDDFLQNNSTAKNKNIDYLVSSNFAAFLDENYSLKYLRDEFYYPKSLTLPKVDPAVIEDANEESVYLCGNSLGIMPKAINDVLAFHLKKWAETGVFGQLDEPEPWVKSDEKLLDQIAELVGAESSTEVGLMNGLTVNIHLLFTAFYKPTEKRHKILLESRAFPSDYYAIESQIRFHGLDPANSMICLETKKNEDIYQTKDILKKIEEEGEQIAIVFFSSIQYYTGQFFDMKKITAAAQAKGCLVGWDCAHSFANVPLYLHDWNVDFACWCTYKYGCTGSGGIGGVFIHSRYAKDFKRERLQGWWGHKLSTRFQMTNKMELDDGVLGYRLSCTPFMLTAAMSASLKADVRYPDVIRVAPVHLYNLFNDCWRFVNRLIESINVLNEKTNTK